jgi:hypothetical protein
MSDFLRFFFCFTILPFIAVIWGLSALQSVSCHNTWKDSGYQADYTFTGGCRVSKDGVVWLPQGAIREVNND